METLTARCPIPLVESVRLGGARGAAQFDVARNGTLVFASAERNTTRLKMVWVNREGSEEVIAAEVEHALIAQPTATLAVVVQPFRAASAAPARARARTRL